MINKKIFIILAIASIPAPAVAVADLTAKMSGALICAENPDGITVMACNMGGKSAINLYALGDNLVSIDESSIKLTRLKVGKQDLLTNASGQPNYDVSFPSVNDEGKLAKFDVIIQSGLVNLEGAVSMKGSITAYTGSGAVVDESPLFDPQAYRDMQVGPVKVTGKAAKQSGSNDVVATQKQKGIYSEKYTDIFLEMIEKGIVTKDKSLPTLQKDLDAAYPDLDDEAKQAIGPMIMSYSLEDAFSMVDDETQFAIKIDAGENPVDKIELVNASGESIESQGSMTVNGVKSYLFTKTDTKQVKLLVHYQKDLKPLKINIDI